MSNFLEKFKEKATIKHGGKYSYHHVKYINAHENVLITCPIHGDFKQTPNSHLNGRGCPKCNGGISLTKEDFIEKARKIHGDKYDYSKVEYVNAKVKVCIICPEHGEFWQMPDKHLCGQGCPICKNSKKYNTKTYVEKCKEKFGDCFIDYSKVKYVNRNTDISLICKKCGREFLVNPHNHLKRGDGCQYCRMSKLEKEVYTALKKEGINFEWHKWFDWMNNGKSHKSLDFYLPDYNIGIECQGMQHFKPVKYFGGVENLEKQIKNDLEKNVLCKNHNISILYYSHIKYEPNIIDNLSDLMEKLKKVADKNS